MGFCLTFKTFARVITAVIIISLAACSKRVKQQDDELYSRHLQRKVKLTVINTPLPDEKSEYNLLVCNDGQELEKIQLKSIIDSLYKAKAIAPLVIVGIHAGDRMEEYGIADKIKNTVSGGKADHYDSFFNNELYPYAKKNAGVRKFKTVVIAGFGAGGLSALDIAWNHPDKISRVGIFSGAFSRKEYPSDTSSTGMMYDKLKTSRKRPDMQFWFYAGAAGNTDIAKDDAVNIITSTAAVVKLLEDKNFTRAGDITYRQGATNNTQAWHSEFPAFLLWAFGKQQ